MMNKQEQQQLEELISAYLDGEVTADEQARAERLLAEDESFRQLHDDLVAMRSGMQKMPTLTLGPDFKDAVLAAAVEAKTRGSDGQPSATNATPPVDTDAPTPAISDKANWHRILYPLAAIAAVLLVAMMTITFTMNDRKLALAPQAAHYEAQVNVGQEEPETESAAEDFDVTAPSDDIASTEDSLAFEADAVHDPLLSRATIGNGPAAKREANGARYPTQSKTETARSRDQRPPPAAYASGAAKKPAANLPEEVVATLPPAKTAPDAGKIRPRSDFGYAEAQEADRAAQGEDDSVEQSDAAPLVVHLDIASSDDGFGAFTNLLTCHRPARANATKGAGDPSKDDFADANRDPKSRAAGAAPPEVVRETEEFANRRIEEGSSRADAPPASTPAERSYLVKELSRDGQSAVYEIELPSTQLAKLLTEIRDAPERFHVAQVDQATASLLADLDVDLPLDTAPDQLAGGQRKAAQRDTPAKPATDPPLASEPLPAADETADDADLAVGDFAAGNRAGSKSSTDFEAEAEARQNKKEGEGLASIAVINVRVRFVVRLVDNPAALGAAAAARIRENPAALLDADSESPAEAAEVEKPDTSK